MFDISCRATRIDSARDYFGSRSRFFLAYFVSLEPWTGRVDGTYYYRQDHADWRREARKEADKQPMNGRS